MNKCTTALCAFMFVFAVALPVYAQEVQTPADMNTTALSPQTLAAPTPNVGVGNWATRNKEMIEQYRKMLAEKRANGTLGQKRAWYATASSSCIQKAVDARETTTATSWTTLASSITSALSVRQKALFDAWGMADGTSRATAIKAAWDAWKKSHRDAFKVLKTERDAAWKTFRTTVQDECRITLPKAEVQGTDVTGSVAL